MNLIREAALREVVHDRETAVETALVVSSILRARNGQRSQTQRLHARLQQQDVSSVRTPIHLMAMGGAIP
jgi:hypothetical protein